MRRSLLQLFGLSAAACFVLASCGRQPLAASSPAGRLAYIAADGNVYIVSADDLANRLAVTDDATAGIEGYGLSYQRISWSPSGQLAFAAVERDGDRAMSKLYVIDQPGRSDRRLIGESAAHFVIYVNWAVGSCDGEAGCKQLAYLIEEDDAIALRTVNLDGASSDNRVAGSGWPFYFSWSADAQQMLWHVGGGREDNSQALYSQFDLASRQSEELTIRPGLQMAPAFSPQNGDWLLVTAENNDLVRYHGQEETVIAVGSGGDTTYAWSPDGRQIAYAMRESIGLPYYGAIHVHDLETGQSRRVIDVGLRTLGFFWSPDGRRIAYLQWIAFNNEDWMQWRVVDVESGRDRGFAAFNPTPHMRYVINSFNQYAQSHRLWSPDGRYLVYMERGKDFQDTIWLVDTLAEGTEPIRVDAGSLAFWSW